MAVTFPDGGHHDGFCAPAALEPVRVFVNTLDLDAGTDGLTDPDGLVEALRGTVGLAAEAVPTAADVQAARALRDALRALLACNHDGGTPDPSAVRVLNATAADADLGVRFAPEGRSVVACGVPGVRGAFGRLLAIVAAAQADGTWTRLKICPADDCGWAFYDVSRNRSRRWCSMEVCGNRAKVRAYRDR
ncbi:CGNR zinc finger domain-containing protein [Paraconexibacter algicola]|uniref:Zinc finger CGNR domain-containing protein n=1 Tax=Paraconexibacter algicola TaxID=2133960 RepID=A0A2T4UFC0_9ACTN|nr:CGNR zinc finger domain-containing protein [Paraconexibacter algicola]PTL56460.1 hypothetical protein C7Y72_15985 [Paraconexibacter algicola]